VRLEAWLVYSQKSAALGSKSGFQDIRNHE